MEWQMCMYTICLTIENALSFSLSLCLSKIASYSVTVHKIHTLKSKGKLMVNTKLQSCEKIENKCCQRTLLCMVVSFLRTKRSRSMKHILSKSVLVAFCFYSVSVLCVIGCLLRTLQSTPDACLLTWIHWHNHCSQFIAETIFQIHCLNGAK